MNKQNLAVTVRNGANTVRNLAVVGGSAALTVASKAADVYGSAVNDTYVASGDSLLTKWQTWVIAIAGLTLVIRAVKKAFSKG